MKPNNEVSAFLNIINVYFHPEKSLNPDLFKKVNWNKFQKALEFHAIRPIVYETFKSSQIEVPKEVLANLEAFSTAQAVAHLSNSIELKRLQLVFKKEAIKMIPFKGVVFQDALYSKGLREAGDIDILVSKNDLEKTLKLLWNDNYRFTLPHSFVTIEDYIHLFDSAHEQCETPLIKNNSHIDLHWNIHHSFLPYNLAPNFIQNLTTDSDRIFWTLLVHHGAKEFWLRLKHLIDLASFVETYGESFDWEAAYLKALEYRMSIIFLNGFFLIKDKLNIQLPHFILQLLEEHNYSSLDKTIKYWNNGKSWATTIPRLHYEQILLSSQDQGFSKWVYLRKIYNTYTKPNPIEPKRFLYFPERFHFLNFLSKVFSYLIKKTFGIK
ncbi:nucleotidyltransferase domain-containing protein [Arcticibacterium luteifluviistationis]|uniref:Nucleotidyltransferase family protein n=1 Tax=Arcticibacterium luteifluviistationis TaxID=1784714 RepID=A0A2Z4G8H8_9BACT|nr:nucleotidyltransferase family protein [Arcticibacterium luteifluviistationis]AWV97405.1 hypothetical protein DJ013_04140 [Arcticibacterium luteifluviistationis]